LTDLEVQNRGRCGAMIISLIDCFRKELGKTTDIAGQTPVPIFVSVLYFGIDLQAYREQTLTCTQGAAALFLFWRILYPTVELLLAQTEL
jgi:hypothetical protein